MDPLEEKPGESPTGDKPAGASGASGQRDVLRLVEVLLGSGAVLAAVTYLLLNAAYLAFYETLGTRPEEAGLDRLAVLARTSGLVVLALYLIGVLIAGVLALMQKRSTAPSDRETSPSHGQAQPALLSYFIVALVAVAGLAFFATLWADNEAHAAQDGSPVNPPKWGPVTILSITAQPAVARWVVNDAPMPAVLADPWLLHLGRSNEVVVFVACGRTLTISADKVTAEVLTTPEDAEQARGRMPALPELSGQTGVDRAQVCEVLRQRPPERPAPTS